ncbi:hypothetical protein EFA69_02160 [Rufibacter immobilis]|uniref:Uncharacterized protein n=1 Tax=Rufibacter immobilis TaxID=1348778 RepID=A0A3M9N7E2_9BACT|nr:hypothetical protein EFA69_02160 [Rufibacter immobilis]
MKGLFAGGGCWKGEVGLFRFRAVLGKVGQKRLLPQTLAGPPEATRSALDFLVSKNLPISLYTYIFHAAPMFHAVARLKSRDTG